MPKQPLSKDNRIWPARKDVKNSSVTGVLEVLAIDLCTEANGKAFHTDKYEAMASPRPSGEPTQLIVRRGAPFTLRLRCNRAYDPTIDTMVLIMAVVPFGSERINFGNGTEVNMLVEQPGSGAAVGTPTAENWFATMTQSVKESDGKVVIVLSVMTSPKAAVAKYNLVVHTRLDTNDKRSSFQMPIPMYLLFNPWCERDDVYLKDEAARQEYVLNDSTMVWKQTSSREGMSSWNLGQFERDILDCALWVIAVTGRVIPTYRGNPVRVVRALSGALNINNGPGVLEGRWNGDYKDGVPPQAWTGSVKILQQFYRKGMQAVRYGQCWVFAGIFATVCRAVGIPMRIVTTFQSAHDTESSLTVDVFIDASGAAATDMSSDSIWNYHVWNEAWMRRPDLSSSGQYDGWQVVDATPQEMSDGMFKLGPASVKAIKAGDLHLQYDCEFVYAEVNADQIFWSSRGAENLPKLLQINTAHVGRDISTKAIGRNDREDITMAYKHPEGSPEERSVMAAALKLGSQRFGSSGVAKKMLETHEAGSRADELGDAVRLELSSPRPNVLGEPFTLELTITSAVERESVKLYGSLVLKHTDYTGKHSEEIKKVPVDVTVRPGQSSKVKVELPFKEYNNPTFDQTHIKAICVVDVTGTDKTLFAQQMFTLATPNIDMRLIDQRHSQLGMTVQGTLKNPLPIPLTDGVFHIEGERHTDPFEKQFKNIEVGGTVSFEYPLKMKHKGKTVVSARFSSRELKDVHGHLDFDMS